MIAVDTSSLIAYLEGDSGADVDAVDIALKQSQAVLPPVVYCEILSDPKLPKHIKKTLEALPLLELSGGYWERAGTTRSKLIKKKRRARLADTLIAQSCIDNHVPLITRDHDFRHFVSLGLKLITAR